jgi:hypothetical protein
MKKLNVREKKFFLTLLAFPVYLKKEQFARKE